MSKTENAMQIVETTHESHEMVRIQEFGRALELRCEAIKQIVPTLLKICNPNGIKDFGGKPFISDSECQKIARAAGVSYSKPDIIAEWEDDPATGERLYEVIVEGEASWMGQPIQVTGGCNSSDKFFKNRPQTLTELKIEVRKKALANWRGACIRHLFGLNSYTWKDFKALGFDQANATKIEFKTGRHSGKDDGGAEKEKTDDLRLKLGKQIFADCGENKKAAGTVLEKLTVFITDGGKEIPGKRTVKSLTDKQVFFLWKKIKPGGSDRDTYENMTAKFQPDEEPKAATKEDKAREELKTHQAARRAEVAAAEAAKGGNGESGAPPNWMGKTDPLLVDGQDIYASLSRLYDSEPKLIDKFLAEVEFPSLPEIDVTLLNAPELILLEEVLSKVNEYLKE